jgi:predicted metal-dependent HD superfamily phosphohydrolase
MLRTCVRNNLKSDLNLFNHNLLQGSWQRCCEGLGAFRAPGGGALSQLLFERLLARYSEPSRQYHSLQHLQECVSHFEAAAGLAICPAEVEMALWFHDAIYELGRHDNEAASASWAETELVSAGVDRAAVDRVKALIMATLHTATPSGTDECLLIDIDLSILGAAEARFQEYEGQIRGEYSFVPEPLFSQKRKEILLSFLNRPRIYSTEYFFQKLETVARNNLSQVV